ncbi:hypothetical protein CI109_101453 [Kwoniella shandongensis]|uniref:Uncharacterized protein n=1 Tax=Kwoniella shandongensis TaxID=1734106 RepID=A0A5M6BV01_9TREE|nr:uncharacterized protein CI109_005149 [Kwoniella shandongensis]KAA5526573.1 hypothetical protein CI109_005149 [Kwoniella shandongensis]
MFKKPLAHQSNATPLRSSARRQLLSSILTQYPALSPTKPTSTSVSDSGDATATTSNDGNGDGSMSEKELGKLVLPEGVRTAGFETSVGVEGTFWLSPDGDPLWMTFGRNSKEYIPTLYLLSLPLPHPPLPIIQLHHPLPPPLLTGAPLFIPAVRNLSKSHLLPDLAQNDLVAFVASTSGRAEEISYVGVGRVVADGGMKGALERRVKNLTQRGGEREEGKFCDILCIVEDHLWELGSKPVLATFPLPLPAKALAPPPRSDSPTPAQADASSSRSSSSSPPPIGNLTIADPDSTSASESSSAPLSPSEISTLLSISLLQALRSLQPTSFPMPASLLYSAHVLPNRPWYIPKEKREEVVIAKSEWKKLTKWMKEVGKEGLLKVKETKGEVVVQSFDAQHPSLQSHVDFKTVAEDEAKAAKKAAREAALTNNDPTAPSGSSGVSAAGGANGKGKEIVVEELWKASGGAITFWEACGVDRSALYQPSELKTILDKYITSHSLLQGDHRTVLLDDELGRAVGVKKPQPGEKMNREEILKKLKASVNWVVSVGGVVKKGPLQPITMTVKTRQGRKTVTHVTGLETFSVDVDSFADEMRKLCAGSASIQPLQGASPKLGLQEVMIQGNQIKLVTEALLRRGIPKRWIKEGEDSKKGKK